jgi:hypothetical protein
MSRLSSEGLDFERVVGALGVGIDGVGIDGVGVFSLFFSSSSYEVSEIGDGGDYNNFIVPSADNMPETAFFKAFGSLTL